MQNTDDLHNIALDAVKHNVRVNERAAKVGGDLGAAMSDLGKLGKYLGFIMERGSVAFGNRRILVFEVCENFVQIGLGSR